MAVAGGFDRHGSLRFELVHLGNNLSQIFSVRGMYAGPGAVGHDFSRNFLETPGALTWLSFGRSPADFSGKLDHRANRRTCLVWRLHCGFDHAQAQRAGSLPSRKNRVAYSCAFAAAL